MENIQELIKKIEQQDKDLVALKKAITVLQRRIMQNEKQTQAVRHNVRRMSSDITSISSVLRKLG